MSRASVKAKIVALRAKTTRAGCTEAEAMAAASLAAELMAKHGLSEADVVMTEAMAPEETKTATWRSTLNGVIACCTNTACISLTTAHHDGAMCLFMGLEPGPEIALYLRDVCYRAVKTELKAFKAGIFYRPRRTLATKRQAVADFTDSMVVRLASRLLDLFAPSRNDAARADAKNALAMRFKGAVARTREPHKTRYSAAADEGWRAGGKVALNHGVGAGADLRRIERAS